MSNPKNTSSFVVPSPFFSSKSFLTVPLESIVMSSLSVFPSLSLILKPSDPSLSPTTPATASSSSSSSQLSQPASEPDSSSSPASFIAPSG